MGHFGEDLRQERERRAMALDTMSAETRVQTRHLEAVEQEEYGTLPGGVFRRGIIRAYLNCLQLEEAEWMSRFEQSYAHYARQHGLTPESGSGWQEFALNVKRNRHAARQSHGVLWTGLLVLLFVVLAAAFWVYRVMLHGRLR